MEHCMLGTLVSAIAVSANPRTPNDVTVHTWRLNPCHCGDSLIVDCKTVVGCYACHLNNEIRR